MTRGVAPPRAPEAPRTVEASVGQRLLWLLDHYRGAGGTVNAPLAWRLRGAVDEAALARALDELTARHEALRTTYETVGRRLIGVVHPPGPMSLDRIDARGADGEAAGSAPGTGTAQAAMQDRAHTAIDASRWPTDAALWRIADDDRLLLLNIHHLATDFFSNAIVSRDLMALYDRASGVNGEPLPHVVWQYADWSDWQREAFAAGRLERLKEFWARRLDGAQLPALPRTGDPVGNADAAAMKVTVDLDPDIVAHLNRVAPRLRTTMFPLMLAAFFDHLHRITGQRDLAIASLFTNRGKPQVQDTVGFFVNMIVLRAAIDPHTGFAELARRARTAVLEGLAHGDLPYQMLPARTVSTTIDGRSVRVDDVVFQYLESPSTPRRRRAVEFEPVEVTVASGRFPLELVVHNQSQCMLRYDARRFSPAWAREFLDGYSERLADAALRGTHGHRQGVDPA